MGLMAAAAFVLFAVGLQRQDRGRPLLRYAGVAVAAASVVTAVPVLWLCMPASTVTPAMLTGLLVASDIADVVLFLAIAGFATAIAIAARGQWTKALALAVALLSIVRAVLLVTGSGLLEVAAPVAFLVLVLVSVRLRYTTTATARLADCCLIRGVYGGRTAAGDASRASGEVRTDPRRGRAVVKQNDKQTASRDDRAHRFGPPAQQVVAPTSCDVDAPR
jgi:hypothetical protein